MDLDPPVSDSQKETEESKEIIGIDLPVTETNEESKEIKPINQETVHRICSGQVVLSLSIAMKELVENSIDAGARIIKIHLKEYGSDLFEVCDNGSGVHSDNFQALTLKHHTSKIQQFDDLENLGTLGFRGEALSSLCALCNVEIITKHQTAAIATKITYDHSGKIVTQETIAREQGTTVTLKDLFSTLPVRRKEFMKNLKKEFSKMCNLLYAYCLIPNGIKYSCTNTTAKGLKSTIVSTEGHKTVRENIISVFGVKQLASLIDVEIVGPEENILQEYGIASLPGEEVPFEFEFLVSSVVHGSGRSSTDRQFFYINQRPCEPSKVIKLVNEIYRQYNSKQYPFVYLNITTKSALVDVNITPDKRQVFLEKEKLLLATLKTSLQEAFKTFPSTFKLQNCDVSKSLLNTSLEQKRGIKRSNTEQNVKITSLLQSFGKRSRSDEIYKKCNTNETIDVSSLLATFGNKSKSDLKNCASKSETIKEIRDIEKDVDKRLQSFIDIACKFIDEDKKEKIIDKDHNESFKEINESNLDISIDSPMASSGKNETPLKINIKSLKDKFESLKLKYEETNIETQVKFRTTIDPQANKTAEEELNRHISQSEFEKMEIIDQHATDEKYNFEQLQMNTVIESQRLVVPKLLELTAAARCVITSNLDVFNKNGFKFKVEADDDNEKIFLTHVPMSHKTVFGKGDIDEMVFMLQEDSSETKSCRPSRVRAMFASRACRKSVMIGDALSKNDMKKLIIHMGEIEQPWNCPHGRPTMRHLVNLNLIL